MKINHHSIIGVGIAAAMLFFAACVPTPAQQEVQPTATDIDLTNITSNPTAFVYRLPTGFPQPTVNPNNPMTVEGVTLGRYLFYDKRLSSTKTQACGSCHAPVQGMSDARRFSMGVTGVAGTRQAMAIQNLAFGSTDFFWDGRTSTLEKQAFEPVENPIEMHETWANVEQKLRADTMYHRLFRKAFNITKVSGITRILATRALEQFEKSIVVGENSRYYKVFVKGIGFPTDEEQDGYDMYNNRTTLPDAQCFHCHNEPIFKSSDYFNNGITEAATLNDFPDKGRGGATNIAIDNGKFRAPTLWNIALTAPYMHDGSMQTLTEVIEHYASHGKYSPNKDAFVGQISLTEPQKQSILAFLNTLTDTITLKKAEFQDPFR